MNSSTPVFQVPVEAHRNRATRRFALSRRRQRKGQALILAVLIMLMVAVLSAGFLVVVSGNLNQTARITDKTRAVESARSGLKFVNDQLTYSQLGENWRPGFIGAPTSATSDQTKEEQRRLNLGEGRVPPQGDPNLSLYYSSVDQANGWASSDDPTIFFPDPARTLPANTYQKYPYAKFPDPLAPRSDAPQYLARVQRIPTELDAGDPDATDATKQGMLKITVIGLSNDDPAAFSKVVAYKGGANAPLGRVMRVVGNYDFKNKTVPEATADYDNNSQNLSISNLKGAFPLEPFSVMIGNAGSNDLQAGVVDSHTGSAATGDLKFHVATDPFAKTLSKVRVELAAQYGSSLPVGVGGTDSAIDFNNNNSIDPGENTSLAVSSGGTAGGARVNGGLAFTGAISLPALDVNAAQTVRASGLMVQQAPTMNSKATVSTSAAPTTQLALANGSNVSGFPGAGISTDLVDDGADRLQGNATGNRTVAEFTPPDISSSAGAGRYRQLTRDSKVNSNGVNPPLAATTTDTASNYGYGQGIYINNPTDRERVYDATLNNNAGGLRDMAQKELVQMWLSRKVNNTDDTADFCRKGAPTVVDSVTASLEQQHLRGWVGPDEFRARGALIELFNDAADGNKPKVAITLDSRSDNTATVATNSLGPVPAKAWKDPATGAIQPGVYRKVFAWPSNGVIFAEGNVRVRGTVNPAGATVANAADVHSLTIVSQNNIYIDGTLSATAQKVLLFARKNVITNPTSLVSRVEAATTFAIGTDTVAVVADAGQFQPGDWIHFNASAATLNATNGSATAEIDPANLARVVSVNAANNTLTLDRNTPGVAAGSLVRAVADPLDPSATADLNAKTVRTTWEKISNFSQVIQRRLPPPVLDVNNAPIPFRLAFLHSAEQRLAGTAPAPALTIAFSSPPGPANAQLTSKTPPPPAAGDPAPIIVAKAQKVLSIKQDDPTADPFPLTNSTTLSAFVTDANNPSSHPPHGTPPPTWAYNFSTPTTTGADYNGINPIALTGIGNRLPLEAPPAVVTYPSQNLLGTGTNDKNMTVATSITPFFGGSTTPTPLITDLWGKAPVPVPAFGFAVDPNANEDVLTGDASFYVPDATGANPQLFALDSRSVPVTATGTQTFALAFSRDSSGTLTGFADPIANPAASNKLPFYRLGALKLENLVPDPSPGANGEVKFSGIKPVSMNINAFVYAQTGSWFVIPAPVFDDAARNNQDAQRDGQMDGSDALNAYRYARYNYQINFKGAIAENQTAVVNTAGTVVGAVQQWSNSWANVTTTATAVDTNTDGTLKENAGVVYTFDPDYADPTNAIHNDPGFVMPQSDQLTYVE